MKRLLITMTSLTTMTMAGFFSTVSGMTMDEEKPSFEYSLDTAGINPRIYEFTPKTDSSIRCVAVFISNGTNGSTPALQCFRVSK